MEGKAENRAKRNTSPVYGIVGFTDTDNTAAERRLFYAIGKQENERKRLSRHRKSRKTGGKRGKSCYSCYRLVTAKRKKKY